MADFKSLEHQLLIATPKLNDALFNKSVIYVCEQQGDNIVGLIINKPLPHSLKSLFKQLAIDSKLAKLNDQLILLGGPLQTDRGFVIHESSNKHWKSSLIIDNNVTITTSSDIIQAIAVNKGPEHLLVTLGFSAWDSKELLEEIKQNYWLVSPCSPEILYEVPFDKRWQYAGDTLGINMNYLTNTGGNA